MSCVRNIVSGNTEGRQRKRESERKSEGAERRTEQQRLSRARRGGGWGRGEGGAHPPQPRNLHRAHPLAAQLRPFHPPCRPTPRLYRHPPTHTPTHQSHTPITHGHIPMHTQYPHNSSRVDKVSNSFLVSMQCARTRGIRTRDREIGFGRLSRLDA
eukprot:COSAG05_NODE_9722_length_606_cov_1.094675_1_plen_155_part_10